MCLCIISTFSFMLVVAGIVLLSLYTFPNPPKLSIEDLSVPAFTKSSDETSAGNICFDLKLRNMNKAIGVYYDDPSSIAFFYYPYDDPYQKYVWEGSVPAFYQGNGKTKHIRSNMQGNNLQLASTVVVDPEEDTRDDHGRTLREDRLQLPSRLAGGLVGRSLVVNIVRIEVVINYRFNYWFGSSKHQLEQGADVLVDTTTGERVSTGSIELEDSAAPAGQQVMLMILFTFFLLIVSF